VPTAPAIMNAIYDAIGIRIKSLPATPEKILHALKNHVPGREDLAQSVKIDRRDSSLQRESSFENKSRVNH